MKKLLLGVLIITGGLQAMEGSYVELEEEGNKEEPSGFNNGVDLEEGNSIHSFLLTFNNTRESWYLKTLIDEGEEVAKCYKPNEELEQRGKAITLGLKKIEGGELKGYDWRMLLREPPPPTTPEFTYKFTCKNSIFSAEVSQLFKDLDIEFSENATDEELAFLAIKRGRKKISTIKWMDCTMGGILGGAFVGCCALFLASC